MRCLGTKVTVWKSIPGYEGLYEVNNHGQVKSLYYRGNFESKILKPGKDRGGYLYVNLHKNGKAKNYRIHRLVAEAFLSNPENLPCINHKDENKENNCLSNLEWCSYEYNINYGTRNERASKKVMCIETNEVFKSICEAERVTGVSGGNISACCNGKRNTAGEYHWQYVD